jgi:hypothetical protein
MKKFLVILALIVLIPWGYVQWSLPSKTLNYRLTVEVDVEGATVTGSSVGTFGSGLLLTWFGSNSRAWGSLLAGEAVGVDLGRRGRLWVLLTRPGVDSGDYLDRLAGRLFMRAGVIPKGVSNFGAWEFRRRAAAIRAYRTPIVLQPDEYPLFVRFRDESDPTSLELVHPENLAESFGPGVLLGRITFTVTDERVTRGAQAALPWLESIGRKRASIIPYSHDITYQPTAIELVSPSDFVDSHSLFKRR